MISPNYCELAQLQMRSLEGADSITCSRGCSSRLQSKSAMSACVCRLMAVRLLVFVTMPGQRLPVRKIRDVLRLRAGGMSKRKIAASLSIRGKLLYQPADCPTLWLGAPADCDHRLRLIATIRSD
jgi:hypothetical protein